MVVAVVVVEVAIDDVVAFLLGLGALTELVTLTAVVVALWWVFAVLLVLLLLAAVVAAAAAALAAVRCRLTDGNCPAY